MNHSISTGVIKIILFIPVFCLSMDGEESITVVELVDWDLTNHTFDPSQLEQNSPKMSLLQLNDICGFEDASVASGMSQQKVLISKNKTTISLDNKEASSFHKGLLSHLTTPKSLKGVSLLKDLTKSSPSSPTGPLSKGTGCQRQRSYSDSDEKLSAQDKACLEEIERGSQLTLEDQELFADLGNHKKFDLDVPFITAVPDESSVTNKGMSKQSVVTKVVTFPAVKQETFSPAKKSISSSENVPVNFIDNIDLDHVDPLESALLQSSIPVSLSNKHTGSAQIIKTVSPTNLLVKKEAISKREKFTKISLDNAVQSHSFKQSNKESQNITLSLPEVALPNAAAQTIKKVVVHFNGNEQVFDVPEFNGEQLTVQPLRILPPAAEGPMNILVPQNIALQNGKNLDCSYFFTN